MATNLLWRLDRASSERIRVLPSVRQESLDPWYILSLQANSPMHPLKLPRHPNEVHTPIPQPAPPCLKRPLDWDSVLHVRFHVPCRSLCIQELFCTFWTVLNVRVAVRSGLQRTSTPWPSHASLRTQRIPNSRTGGPRDGTLSITQQLSMSLRPVSRSVVIEGSLEVKLPTIWTDEKQSRAEAERRERLEERRSEEKESEERRCRCAKR